MSERERLEVNVQRQRCPYCKDEVAPQEEKVACDACMAWHHAECWTAHGACSGCASTTITGAQAQVQVQPPPPRVRACKRLRCLEAATEVLASGEWCRSHARSLLQRQANETWFYYLAAFWCLFGVVSAVAFWGFAPGDPAAMLIAVPFIFCVALALIVGPLRRRKGRELLERLDAKDEEPAKA